MAASSTHSQGRQRWLPTAAARELVWWDAAGLAQLSAELAHAARAWGAAWGVDTSSLRAVAQPLASVPDIEPGGTAVFCGGTAVGWWSGERAARTALLHALFAELPSTVDLARHVTAECHADAVLRLAVVLGAEICQDVPAAPITAADVRTGSGAIEVRIEGAPIASLVLSGAGTQVWRARRALSTGQRTGEPADILCAPAAALCGRAVPVHADLEGCELDLGTLQALQVGDVLRLRHPLRDPAIVSDGTTGTRLFSGHLAQLQGAMALELGALRP